MESNKPSNRKPKSATFQLHEYQDSIEQEQQDVTPAEENVAGMSTKLRPGTPAPIKANSNSNTKQMHSLSAIENETDTHRHIVTGSKSAPVPSHGRNNTFAGPRTGHHNGHHGQAQKPHNTATLAAGGSSKSTSQKKPQGKSSVIEQFRNGVLPEPSQTFKEPKVQLAVVCGSVFIPTRTKPSLGFCSFIETAELGPPGADRRWIVDMKGFREDEIIFTLEGFSLKVEGLQTTRPSKPAYHSETISLPINYNIECLKVYRNKVIGTLVIAYFLKSLGLDNKIEV